VKSFFGNIVEDIFEIKMDYFGYCFKNKLNFIKIEVIFFEK
jgi:hypothetical protein